MNAQQVRAEVGYFDDAVERRVDEGHEVGGADDRKALRPGTWLLWWRRTNQGFPHKKANSIWHNVERIVDKAFAYEGEELQRDCTIAPADPPLPYPFNVEEPKFALAFRDVLSRDKYNGLRADDAGKSWFTQARVGLIREFWRDLSKHYRQL